MDHIPVDISQPEIAALRFLGFTIKLIDLPGFQVGVVYLG